MAAGNVNVLVPPRLGRLTRFLRWFIRNEIGAAGVVDRTVSRGLDVWGHVAVSFFKYTGPNPYATGGDPQSAQAFKLGVLEYIDIGPATNAGLTLAVVLVYDHVNSKMQAFWQNPTDGANEGLKEVDNGTDLSGFTARGVAMGRG